MFAKLKHVAIVSDRFTLLGKFYESLFGMRSSKPSSDEPRGAATVGDGYVGLNINSRAPGRQSGLDHFGFEVEDVAFSHKGGKSAFSYQLDSGSNRYL